MFKLKLDWSKVDFISDCLQYCILCKIVLFLGICHVLKVFSPFCKLSGTFICFEMFLFHLRINAAIAEFKCTEFYVSTFQSMYCLFLSHQLCLSCIVVYYYKYVYILICC